MTFEEIIGLEMLLELITVLLGDSTEGAAAGGGTGKLSGIFVD